jgi:S1-C subfamily serine protease
MRLITPLVLAATLAVAPPLAAQVVYGRGGNPARTTVRVSDDRAVLGITTSSGGARDTLGLLVSSVTPGGPADSAGIEEGNRIVAVNGVNLRLNPADAGDPDMAGVLGRRLQRELDKATAGDNVELRVWADGQTKTVRVKTVRADALQTARGFLRSRLDDRTTLGASVGGMWSVRDTLGVFVVAVNEDGPLAKAGIFEGARIASINEVDLRVPAADAGDEFMTGARIRRFTREVEKLQPGANAALRVYFNGQYRDVTVQAVKRSDLKDAHSITIFRSGGSGSLLFPGIDGHGFQFEMRHDIPEIIRRSMEEAQSATQRTFERLRSDRIHQEFDGDRELEEIMRRMEERLRDTETSAETRARLGELQSQLLGGNRVATATLAGATPLAMNALSMAPAVMATAGPIDRRETRAFTVEGVRLGPVDEQLASYLGAGSERGLLVLDIDARWTGIRVGDVLLAIDGRPVRHGGITHVSFNTPGEYRVELLRAGKRLSEVIRAH